MDILSFVPKTSSVVKVIFSPVCKVILPFSTKPVLISGPFVSSIIATERPEIREASRIFFILWACSSWLPWEKLRRAIFIPSLIN